MQDLLIMACLFLAAAAFCAYAVHCASRNITTYIIGMVDKGDIPNLVLGKHCLSLSKTKQQPTLALLHKLIFVRQG